MTAQSNTPQPTFAPTLDREDDLLAGSLRSGMLNDLLRQQLSPTQPKPETVTEQQSAPTLQSAAAAAVTEILNAAEFDRSVLHDKLSTLFYQQKAVYQQTDIEPALRKHQFICHTGLIMSPDNCITTQLDDLRVKAFIRGVHQAISDKLENAKSVHVVYPACGPFAPLLMPLLGYYKSTKGFSPAQLRVTLIDIQPGAVQTLNALVEQMGVKDYIRQILNMDALAYDPGERAVDIVMLEAMQHGFSREGHFCIARHYAGLLADDGIFLPQEIRINAALNDPNREYIAQWQDAGLVSFDDANAQIIKERKELGEVARINRDNLINCKERTIDQHTVLVEFGKVQIPPLPQDIPEQVLLMCSQVNVYKDEWIREYDSGITHPLPDTQVCVNFTPKEDRPGDLLVNSGDAIVFYYRVNGLPGFMATWAQGE